MNNARGQVTSEFYLSVLMLLVVFLLALGVAGSQSGTLSQARDWFAAKYAAQKIAYAMNKVYVSGNGASLNLTIEGMGDESINESITLNSGSVFVQRSSASASAQVLAAVNATSITYINSSEIRITNSNGVLQIAQ